jgi:hypothetical protein
MNIQRAAIALTLVVLLSIPAIVYAHEEITVGDYKIKYGWKNEPPIAGEPNAVTLDIVNSKDANAKIDITELKVEALYGGETKTLFLKPVSGQTGKFQGQMTPTRAGQYTIRLSGKISTTEVKADVKPEEVEPADTVQFPRVASGQAADSTSSVTLWVAIGATVLAVIGIGLSLIALNRKN